MKQTLKINSYEVWMSLGITKEEQAQLQAVHFDVTLQFDKAVKGSASDHLDDAIDYAALTNHIKKVALVRSYQLIENICFMAHQHLTEWLKSQGFVGELITEATKLHPPIAGLQGGVKFACQSTL